MRQNPEATAATLSYVNREYGTRSASQAISPTSGDEAQLSWGDLGPFQMDLFIRVSDTGRGGVADNSYPGTDFKSAFVNVSVNSRMTSEACTQFAFPEPSVGAVPSSKDAAAKVKIGALESVKLKIPRPHDEAEDAKYYHAFSNGACYEFALGIGRSDECGGITTVDRQAVFAKLERSWPR